MFNFKSMLDVLHCNKLILKIIHTVAIIFITSECYFLSVWGSEILSLMENNMTSEKMVAFFQK